MARGVEVGHLLLRDLKHLVLRDLSDFGPVRLLRCHGDSGGPAFWIDPLTGEETLVAIFIWGGSFETGNSFHYRIDTEESLRFIQDVIDSLEQEWDQLVRELLAESQ